MTASALTNHVPSRPSGNGPVSASSFYDPTGSRYGFPTFPFHYAPKRASHPPPTAG